MNNRETKATIEQLCKTVQSYFPEAKVEQIEKAYAFAEKAHRGQLRSSGEPYIIHPLEVALTLAEFKLDVASVITGLLHDTVEDTGVTIEQVENEFGKDVALLVDGVTKLSKMTFRTTEEKQAENFRKMLVAMAKDIRVILVKLADRLNNMRTLQFLAPHKQQIIAQETLDIYSPIANRLGMSVVKIELEDLCLRYLHPDAYLKLAQKVAKTRVERDGYMDDVCAILQEKLSEYEVVANVSGRSKHFYSIFRKMERRQADFEEIYDLFAFRITVENITECYKALGVIHAAFKPIPGRFKDYIAMPKPNGYQSLHTTVIGPKGERIEIQIRTEEMHRIAEAGIAAHWKYKEGKFENQSKDNVNWVNRLLEWQKDLTDPNEFLETVKLDLFSEEVFVFTPRGDVLQLSHGATPLDFAYLVHTDVGNKCVGAKVNGRIVPLKHRLKSGDTVEVITSNTQQPSKDWLKIVKSSRAKAKIRAVIKQLERDKSKVMGRDILEKAFREFDQNLNRLEKSGEMQKALDWAKLKLLDELYAQVGYGKLPVDILIRQVLPEDTFEARLKETKTREDTILKKIFSAAKKKSENRNAIIVAGLDDILIRFGKCCNPLPGDGIIGFITRGRGVTVHTAVCPKAIDLDASRRVDVKWNSKSADVTKCHARIRVLANDEPGLLAVMSHTISGAGVNISSAQIRTTKDKKAICIFDVQVGDISHLQKVSSALEAKKGVISVERLRG